MIRRWTPWRILRCPTKPTTRVSARPLHRCSASLASPKRAATQNKHLLIRTGKRSLFTESIPPVLISPAIFIGLLVALWTWKCFWIVVMQDKLLYLSWLPPLSRSESIADYAREFRGVEWTEKRIRSLDGTALAVCEGRFPGRVRPGRSDETGLRDGLRRRVVICYFQGNGGSTPLRLPLLSQVMKAIQETSGSVGEDAEFILVALSYRGYWKSSGRATQSGIEQDAQAFLSWVSETYMQPGKDVSVVLWGHSLGAAVASSAVARSLARPAENKQPPISGLILEAPISSIKDMLISLYPQKWLPYRYLWPFSWNTWDVSSTLQQMARYKTAVPSGKDSSKRMSVPPIFLMSAENDEVIPLWVADQLEEKARASGLGIQRKSVKGAMHIEGPLKIDGRTALVDFIINSSAGDR